MDSGRPGVRIRSRTKLHSRDSPSVGGMDLEEAVMRESLSD
jgi:hypothetical protein